MSKQYLTPILPALMCLLALNLGCSSGSKEPRVYPVKGTVLFKGEPTAGAKVAFIPVDDTEAAPAWGVVDDEGRFQLTTRKHLDGAQKGEYYVTVSWIKPINPNSNDTDYTDELLPNKYQDPKASDLIVVVDAKTNQLEPIELN